MRSYAITIVGDLMNGSTNTDVANHACYVGEHAGMLVPGVVRWDYLMVATNAEGKAEITATITAEDAVTGNANGYNGEAVTPEFITSYILGAEDYWLLADGGPIFSPDAVALEKLATV